MPCTPNPTTGFLMYVYRSEIVMLDMTIEDGAKLIVSAGLVAPEYKRKCSPRTGADRGRPCQPDRGKDLEPEIQVRRVSCGNPSDRLYLRLRRGMSYG